MRKLVQSNRTAIRKCYKKTIIWFLGKHVWRRALLSRCTASTLERYYRKTSSNIFSSDLWEITGNFYSTCGTTAIGYPLLAIGYPWLYFANVNSNVLPNAIICEVYHWQLILINQYISIWSLWNCISFSFLADSFFQP